MQKQGMFFVIEGTDGSGKGTQFELLKKRFESAGYEIAVFDFPQYENASSHFIREYLNGNYGAADEVGPYTASLFFALDRYEAAPRIKEALTQGKIVLAKRFTGSNMAHQGTKFNNSEERRGYFIWLDNLEFEVLKVPRPDKSFVLRVPADTAQKLVDQKAQRSYTDLKRDIHEADINHLRRSVEVYDDLCQLFPKDFQSIDCVRGDKLMAIDKINDILWKTIEPLLPVQDEGKGGKMSPKAKNNPYIVRQDGQFNVTAEGQEFLEQAVTDPEGNVYAMTDALPQSTIAAAMARLSRRGDDMRITLLDEFAHIEGKDEDLLRRVITAFGDDSVQQLNGQHLVVEGASNLLTKQLEWGRLAAYLEQSTRYIYFDQKDKEGKYKYFVPELESDTSEYYVSVMDQIFDKYSKMVHRLTDHLEATSSDPEEERDGAWRSAVRAQACDAIRPVLPVATKSTVGIYGSDQAIEQLIMRLNASDSLEARETGQKILSEVRKVQPVFFERADQPEKGGAATAYLANTRKAVAALALQHLSEKYGDVGEPVTLRDHWPKNEFDLVPHMLYEHSNLSLKEIEAEVATWTYDQKTEVFNTYIGERLNRRHRPGRALEMAHYSWDLVCDYGIFRDLQRHRMVDDLEWQPLTPRFGYETPDLVDEAGLSDTFGECFDLAAELYSALQEAGYPYEAQYATLLGHRMRWKVTYNAREAFHLHELRTTPHGHPGYRKLVLQMHEKLSEVHPHLGAAMKFVNKGEDPELTRLAAERHTQFKLSQLG